MLSSARVAYQVEIDVTRRGIERRSLIISWNAYAPDGSQL